MRRFFVLGSNTGQCILHLGHEDATNVFDRSERESNLCRVKQEVQHPVGWVPSGRHTSLGVGQPLRRVPLCRVVCLRPQTPPLSDVVLIEQLLTDRAVDDSYEGSLQRFLLFYVSVRDCECEPPRSEHMQRTCFPTVCGFCNQVRRSEIEPFAFKDGSASACGDQLMRQCDTQVDFLEFCFLGLSFVCLVLRLLC